MKIAFITNSLSFTGGVGKYSCSLAHSLSGAGHEILVIHDDAGASPQIFKTVYIPKSSLYGSEAADATPKVMTALNQFSPDIVHVQACMNYTLEKEIRRTYPAVKSLHVYDFCPSGTKFHFANQKACCHKPGFMCIPRMLYKRCSKDKNPSTLWMFYRRAKDSHMNDIQYSKMLVASEYVKKQALQAGYQPAQLEVLPYYTSFPLAAAETNAESGDKIFMATGRMLLEKGFDKLLNAAALLKETPGWKIVFDGHGAELNNLKQQAHRLGLEKHAEFPGWLSPEKHEELYRKSYAVLVPSIWPEPFGLVGIEAMSYGKPVIAFQSGGIPDWLKENENGYLVPAGDVRLFSEKMLFLLQHPEKAAAMGKNGFHRASVHYTEEIHVQRLLKLYGQLALEKP